MAWFVEEVLSFWFLFSSLGSVFPSGHKLSVLSDAPVTVSRLLCRNQKARAVLSADVKLKVLSPLW